MDRSLDEILKEDKVLRRFIEVNLDTLSILAQAGHGEINAPVKDGKIIINRKKVVLEG